MAKITPKKDARRAYKDLAWTESILSPPEEAVKLTELFSKVIKEHSKIEVKTLLHIGCGAGRDDYTFKKHFKVTGVDISGEMLKLARELNPEVNYCYGDMRTVRLGEYFDAVTMPDSIGYMRTGKDLHRAFITAYEHLKLGGVFLVCIEEEEIAERFKPINIIYTGSQGDVEITLFENCYDPEPTDTSYEATHIYLIRRKGKLEVHSDHHLVGIFPLDTWHNLLSEVGFEVREVKTVKWEYSLVTKGEYPSIVMFICIKKINR